MVWNIIHTCLVCVSSSRSILVLYRYLQAVLLLCCLPRGTPSIFTRFWFPRHPDRCKPERTLRTRVHTEFVCPFGSTMKHHDGQGYLLLDVMTGSGGCLTALNYNAARLSCRSSPFLWLLRWPWRALETAASTSTITILTIIIEIIIIASVIICHQLDAPKVGNGRRCSRLFSHFLVG